MRKWWIGIVGILLFIGGLLQYKALESGAANEPDLKVEILKLAEQKTGTKLELTPDMIYKGNLLLVNKQLPVPANLGVDEINLAQHVELVDGFGLLDSSIELTDSLLQSFTSMVKGAAAEGINHFLISSGYRNQEKQQKLFEEEGADYAMPPGYSEHNLGLSIDIGSSLSDMNHAPEGSWLQKSAWQYGFVLRYPKDKVDITGIKYEPWHFRYVGLPHSAIMKAENLALEQYLTFIKERKQVKVSVNGRGYEIFYYPVTQNRTIYIPENCSYEISGDNRDGVIVTVNMSH